jgi:hypothetical protein
MDGMEKARRELEMLAPALRLELQVHRDGSRACGLSDAAARLRVIFVRFFEVLRARSELQNKFLLRCARMLQGMEREHLTRDSFASGDFGSESCQKAYNALLALLIVKQEMEQDEINLDGLWTDCPLQGLFTRLHMAFEETRGVLRNAAVCMIACLVSDLPAAIAQWQEEEKLMVAATATRTALQTAAIVASLEARQLEDGQRAALRHKIKCRLYGFVKDEDPPPPCEQKTGQNAC